MEIINILEVSSSRNLRGLQFLLAVKELKYNNNILMLKQYNNSIIALKQYNETII